MYHRVRINNPPLSVKISQLFSLGFYSFEISDKSRSGVLFFEVKIAQNFRALRARFCRFALTNAKITQKIGRFAPPGLYFFGRFAPKIFRASIFSKILPNVSARGKVDGGVLILTLWYQGGRWSVWGRGFRNFPGSLVNLYL